jgi:hypothetical protein
MDQPSHLVICVRNEGAEDLQVLKIYRRMPDEVAEPRGFLRVVDDSGEDYLYPKSNFLALPVPRSLERQLETIAQERSRVEIA